MPENLAPGSFRFDRFVLDPSDRKLAAEGVPVELNARYFDALALLVGESGKLVSKDRFLEEVWAGVPVTDEALTQCIKTLRRQLGDDAASPRFIETVPKHGYRFIAQVERHQAELNRAPPASHGNDELRRFFLMGGAGAAGAGFAGIIGGLVYGFAGASQPMQSGAGSLSVLLVMLCLTFIAALTGGIGVSFGIAAARVVAGRPGPWTIAGGAIGGMAVGGVVKLLGLDAFNLLLGRSPGDITGGFEGAVLGGAVGLGAWLTGRGRTARSLRRRLAIAGAAGAAAGLTIALVGGRLMAGSLELLAEAFPNSQLRLDQLGRLFGESGFGPISHGVSGAVEGTLFGACIVGAMAMASKSINSAAAREPE